MKFAFILFSILLISCLTHSTHLKGRRHHTERHKRHHDIYRYGSVLYGHPETTVIHVLNGDGTFAEKTEAVVTAKAETVTCVIKLQPFYQICHTLTDCGMCSSSPHCGWCPTLSKCFPGTEQGASCPDVCPNQWVFSNNICTTVISSGKLTNIAPEARTLISPEIAKAKVHFVTNHPALVRRSHVVGTHHTHHHFVSQNQATGAVTYHNLDTQQPVIAQTEQVANIQTHHLVNLDGTPMPPKILSYHGAATNGI